MKSSVALKFAVSAMTIATTMVACKPAAMAYRPAFASEATPKAARDAADLYAKAQAALQKGDSAKALASAERAVELAPRDLAYRMLLADLYLKNGRFQSAQTTFRDVLVLDPGNARAALAVALTEVALGHPADAVAGLDRLADSAQPTDLGLAYALAGQPKRAIELLEPAARAPGASGRTRQNLALAYALDGEWQKARLTAAQDVSPAELGARLQQWAALAEPSAPAERVAVLLGVRPAADSGQPARLALAVPAQPAAALAEAEPAPTPAPTAAPAPEPVTVAAAAAPAPVPAPIQAAPAPVQTAQAVVPDWDAAPAKDPAPQPAANPAVEDSKPLYAEAVQALVRPNPAVIRASLPVAPVGHFAAPAHRGFTRAVAPARSASGSGKYAVQLGSFSSAGNVERAWAQAYKRYGFADHIPL
ncbi:MAG: hypothetical protein QOH86_471, partial [Sphingomonadales bacterium]|nr:hypothetical protein [Sphingomonadales bacterium]